jgi:hypothetical protein
VTWSYPRFIGKQIMDKATKRRWIILLSLAVATAVASLYPTDDAPDSSLVAANTRTSRPAAKAADIVDNPLAAVLPGDVDPFAPRGWQAPPPPAPIQVAPVAPKPIAPPAPVGPPPLPFKFMGRMNDDGEQLLYLSRGDQTFIARSGETLEGAYKVLGIDAQGIEFEHLPTGEKQTLTIPASEN